MIYVLYLWFLSNTSNNIWHAFKKRCTYSIFFHLHLYFFFGAKYIPQTQIYCNIIELKNLIYSIFILSTVLYVFVFSSQMHSYSKFFRILNIFLYHLLIVFVILAKYIPQFIQIEIHMFFFLFHLHLCFFFGAKYIPQTQYCYSKIFFKKCQKYQNFKKMPNIGYLLKN